MFARLLTPPKRSFFLLGPRGTGKSTWLKHHLRDAKLSLDLLRSDVYLRYLQNPGELRTQVAALAPEDWVVIDEVQRVPELLHEVHALMFDSNHTLHFCLTGSSARKLRQAEVNMLAGRALTRSFFPLSLKEMDEKADIHRVLSFGALPAVYSSPADAVDILDAYVQTYLETEIQQEAVTRSLPAFSRFLKGAAIMNGQVVNVAGLARDVGVKRPTVERYFQVLVDTLIGTWVPSWQPRVKVREIASPKFYFFDPGVVRAILTRTRDALRDDEKGSLLEIMILNEVRVAMTSLNCGGDISYYRTTEQREIDFIWHRGTTAIGIEVKASTRWRSEFGSALSELHKEKVVSRCIGVYLGATRQTIGAIDIFPVEDFVSELQGGEILKSL
jgi:uncharacterized protein